VCWWKAFENAELEALIKKGIAQNFELKIALEKIEYARSLNNFAFAEIFPQVDLFSDILKANLGTGLFTDSKPTGNFTAKFLAIDTLWEIDLWGRLRRQQKAAQYQWEADIEGMRDALIMVAAEIAQTYITLCALQGKIAVTQSNLELDTAMLSLNTDRFMSGLDAMQVPLTQASDVALIKTNLLELIVQHRIAHNKLAFLLGVTPDQLQLNSPDGSVPLPQHEVQLEQPYELMRRRPDIRKAERLLAASYEEIGSVMAEWFPKITLLGFLGQPHNSGGCLQARNEKLWAIGPLLNWPVIDFGRIYFQVKAKESTQRQALLTYEERVTNAVQEVENWLVSYVEEKKKFNTLQTKLQNEIARLDLTRALYKSGIESEITVLMQQKRVNAVRIEQITSEEKISSSFIALYKAFGGDW